MILFAGAVDVAGGVVITDLCIHGTGKTEHQIFIIQQLHVFVKVAIHITDPGGIAVKTEGSDIQFVNLRR